MRGRTVLADSLLRTARQAHPSGVAGGGGLRRRLRLAQGRPRAVSRDRGPYHGQFLLHGEFLADPAGDGRLFRARRALEAAPPSLVLEHRGAVLSGLGAAPARAFLLSRKGRRPRHRRDLHRLARLLPDPHADQPGRRLLSPLDARLGAGARQPACLPRSLPARAPPLPFARQGKPRRGARRRSDAGDLPLPQGDRRVSRLAGDPADGGLRAGDREPGLDLGDGRPAQSGRGLHRRDLLSALSLALAALCFRARDARGLSDGRGHAGARRPRLRARGAHLLLHRAPARSAVPRESQRRGAKSRRTARGDGRVRTAGLCGGRLSRPLPAAGREDLHLQRRRPLAARLLPLRPRAAAISPRRAARANRALLRRARVSQYRPEEADGDGGRRFARRASA